MRPAERPVRGRPPRTGKAVVEVLDIGALAPAAMRDGKSRAGSSSRYRNDRGDDAGWPGGYRDGRFVGGSMWVAGARLAIGVAVAAVEHGRCVHYGSLAEANDWLARRRWPAT